LRRGRLITELASSTLLSSVSMVLLRCPPHFASICFKELSGPQIFDDHEEDQYDFHSYTMRKYTFNVYLQFISWADTLRKHPGYARAALAASKVSMLFLRLRNIVLMDSSVRYTYGFTTIPNCPNQMVSSSVMFYYDT
jgi:hypothetical protein